MRHLLGRLPHYLPAGAIAAALLVISMACSGAEEATPTPVPPKAVVATPTAAPAAVVVPSTTEPQRGGILKVANNINPAHWDLHQSTTTRNASIQGTSYDMLLRFNPEDRAESVIPDLAESWEISDGGLRVTFKLRPGVKFHDGEILTAEDVVATYKGKVIDPPVAGILSPRRGFYGFVTEINALDDLTVEFVSSRPIAVLLKAVATVFQPIISKKTLEEHNYNLREVPEAPGTGPFISSNLVVDERWEKVRNPDYWREGRPYLDEIHYVASGNSATQLAALLAGNIHVGGGGIDALEFAAEHEEITAFPRPTANARFGYYNFRRDIWADERIRRAFHLVLNRKLIADTGLKQKTGHVPWGGPWLATGGMWEVPKDELLTWPGYRQDDTEDIAEAQRLMAAAGFPDGVKDIRVIMRGTSTMYVDLIGPMVMQQLGDALGVTGVLESVQSALWFEMMQQGGWDISIGSGIGTFDDPSDQWRNSFTTGAGQNYGNYSNAEFDALVDKIDTTLDNAKRHELVAQGNVILEADPPAIIQGWLVSTVSWREEVQDGYYECFSFYECGRAKEDAVWLNQ